MQFSDKSFTESAERVDTKTAWAKYVRNRWPQNVVCEVQREWGLSDGEARGLVYATVSQRTIDKIRSHGRGGLLILLEVEALAWGLNADQLIHKYIALKQKEQADARAQIDHEAHRTLALSRRLGALGGRLCSGRGG